MKLSGVVTALVTPFDCNMQLDEYCLREHIEYQIQSGVQGLCPLGGTGEPLSLSRDEIRRVIDITAEQCRGRVPFIVGVLFVSPNDILGLAAYAAEAGAAAVMLVPPYFVRAPMDHVFRHFADIGQECSLPFFIFNTPSRSGVHLSVDFMLKLLDNTDKFIGVKDSTGNILELQLLRKASGSRLTILQGIDALFFPSLSVGADGGILAAANLCPEYFMRLYEAWRRGEVSKANRMQSDLLNLLNLLYSGGHPAPLKQALGLVRRPAGTTRRPLYDTQPHTIQAIRLELEKLGLGP